ncbi:hypothetical protein MM326_15200 [Alkalihalobacillus sp. LMS6]|uniref:hypothetical protein n=1 Tax=Alkalihalobacillus sp. LMS6 TaxID=2924034 RepID=UPI0020D15460|nr:hypothetical protein [Alkalihalobacillus sp. LMS6]UTR05443.1 hypothetical protein MM326_15200 [Alkalihalobacillus sp. LMS6]
MGFRYDMQGKSEQAQAIVRQREREEKRMEKENERKQLKEFIYETIVNHKVGTKEEVLSEIKSKKFNESMFDEIWNHLFTKGAIANVPESELIPGKKRDFFVDETKCRSLLLDK